MTLGLRMMNPRDSAVIAALHSVEDYVRLRIDPDDIGDFHDAQADDTLVILDDDEIVGTIMVTYAPLYMGFWVAKPHRGRGIARAALRSFFRLWAVRGLYTAECWPDNEACQRTLLGAGFTDEGAQYDEEGLLVRRFTRYHPLGSVR